MTPQEKILKYCAFFDDTAAGVIRQLLDQNEKLAAALELIEKTPPITVTEIQINKCAQQAIAQNTEALERMAE